jgi:hypothetical protein
VLRVLGSKLLQLYLVAITAPWKRLSRHKAAINFQRTWRDSMGFNDASEQQVL